MSSYISPFQSARNFIASKFPHCDNTLRTCFKACKRKFYFQHRLHLRTYYGSTALRYGSTYHAAQEAFYNHIKENGWTRDGEALKAGMLAAQKEWEEISAKEQFYEDYRTLENCFNSVLRYMSEFASDAGYLKVIASEEPFKVLMQLETEKEFDAFPDLKPFHFTGKKDLEVELNGRSWIFEHKTTGMPIDQQAVRLNRSAQVMGYIYATIKKYGGRKNAPDGALINLHQLTARKSTAKGKEGQYGEPTIAFRRVPQVFNDNDLYQWRLSMLDAVDSIQKEEKKGTWVMNHDSCFNYNKACTYLSICQASEDLDDLRYDEGKYYIGEAWEVAKGVSAEDVII